MFISTSDIKVLTDYFKAKSFIKTVSIYGSVVNGRANANSDLDLLVEIDYEKLPGNGISFLAIYEDLSQLLRRKVSIITTHSISPYIKPYVENEGIVIYERDLDKDVFGFFVGDFDKSMYRDLARLKHIQESLSKLVKWSKNLSLSDFQNNQIIISASLKELELTVGFALQLSINTLQFLQDESQLNDGDSFTMSFFENLKKNMGPYFGSDSAVIFDILEKEIPKQLRAFTAVIEAWEFRFKKSLANYFISFLYYKLSNDIRHPSNSQFENYRNQVFATVRSKPLESLTPTYIEEGERNLTWFAYQLNIKKTWEGIVDGICPFFPIC